MGCGPHMENGGCQLPISSHMFVQERLLAISAGVVSQSVLCVLGVPGTYPRPLCTQQTPGTRTPLSCVGKGLYNSVPFNIYVTAHSWHQIWVGISRNHIKSRF